jgi:hypothetical protein
MAVFRHRFAPASAFVRLAEAGVREDWASDVV